jgi:hypothetical protein
MYIYICICICPFLLGYALQKNEQMLDRMLLECVKYKIRPDLILFNGAIDAYIRCGKSQKAIDIYDIVMNNSETFTKEEASTATNKEKAEILDISKAFSDQELRPNIRTYNTLLKAYIYI